MFSPDGAVHLARLFESVSSFRATLDDKFAAIAGAHPGCADRSVTARSGRPPCAFPSQRPRSEPRKFLATRTDSRDNKKMTLRVALPVLMTCCLLSACVGNSIVQPLPTAWGSPSGRMIGECPDIQGTFKSTGIDLGLQEVCRRGVFDAGNWNCSQRLDEQFRLERAVSSVRITQRDPDTVVFSGEDAGGRIVSRKFMRSNGDFVCNEKGLIFSSRGSFFSDENTKEGAGDSMLATAGGLLLLRGGVRTLEKTLYTSGDGDLIMNISLTNSGIIFPIPFNANFTAWVRWPAATK